MSLAASYNSASGYEHSGRLSNAVARLGRSRVLRDFRTYYRFALFAVSITCFLNALVFILSFLRFAIFDVIYFGFMATFSGVLAASIHYLMKYSQMPESTHWMTNAQTHITGSSIIAFFMFSFSSSLRAPFSGSLRVCLSMNTKDFLGNLRCQLVLIMNANESVETFKCKRGQRASGRMV
ncbi:hypothetical protein GALMADRAFT_1241786 [Galerina marginata CBS 339.88]|uniref:Uncharacterized protein n=1 Tax=Galerina marginata (strain CBS 339.88) TaxID=685588 RepID=A0A067TAW6_GALM3|nr:hypothetical protein GALMADRAFT_1241786 [Galerina marginata CBS 339.88]